MKLLYHRLSARPDISPFDREARRVVRNQVCFACPYLSLTYFERLRRRTRSWRLLTDLDVWVRSRPRSEREALIGFINDQKARIRDVPGLHAKVIATANELLIGSASLTRAGITQRVEMGVLTSDAALVAEALVWYESTWRIGTAPNGATLEAALHAPDPSGGASSTSSRTSPVDAQLEPDDDKDVQAQQGKGESPTSTRFSRRFANCSLTSASRFIGTDMAQRFASVRSRPQPTPC